LDIAARANEQSTKGWQVQDQFIEREAVLQDSSRNKLSRISSIRCAVVAAPCHNGQSCRCIERCWQRYIDALHAQTIDLKAATAAWHAFLVAFLPDEISRRSVPLPKLLSQVGSMGKRQ
jgi:hypothetical protein